MSVKTRQVPVPPRRFGLPAGGAAGQIPGKYSDEDGDIQWVDGTVSGLLLMSVAGPEAFTEGAHPILGACVPSPWLGWIGDFVRDVVAPGGIVAIGSVQLHWYQSGQIRLAIDIYNDDRSQSLNLGAGGVDSSITGFGAFTGNDWTILQVGADLSYDPDTGEVTSAAGGVFNIRLQLGNND